MATKRSTPLDDPPSASSDDDETEDEQEQELITQKTIQESSSSSEEVDDDDDEEEEESEEETPEPVKNPLEKPKFQNPNSKTAESSSEEESESESEEGTPPPVKTSTEMPKTLTPKSSSIFEFESDVRSPSASDFAIKPSKKINAFESPEKSATSKRPRPSSVSNLKDKKKVKVSNGDADDEKKSVIKRVWSDNDEIMLLQGFIDYQSRTGRSPLSEMDGFYEFTMKSIPGNASKSQLYEKIRRMKKKFRVNSEKVSGDGEDPVFSKPHEHKLFELSKKIWGIDGCESVAAAGGSSVKPKVRRSKAKPKIEVKNEVEYEEMMPKTEEFEALYLYWNAGLNSEVSTSLKFPAGVVTLVKENMNLIGEDKAKEMNEKWKALFENEAMLHNRRIALLSNIGDVEAARMHKDVV